MQQHNCKQELNKLNLRATPARVTILKLLETELEPLDVNTIINYLKNKKIKTNSATVFRIMNAFTEKGITSKVQFREGKVRYELKSKGDHHHLVCERCENIEEVSDCAISELEKEIKRKKKFLVKSHSLEFFGLCSNCQINI